MSPCLECRDDARLSRSPESVPKEHCHDEELPADAFVALRVAYGMLLGEDDFRVLMGNPRGKQMLHTAWLHGSGVVWGLRACIDDERLVVEPGLAVDGVGRELRLETTMCLDLDAWATKWVADHPPADGEDTVTAWVVAEFASCPDRPVPALADPCDVSRTHDRYSRIVESVRVTVTDEPPARREPSFPRLRALLGVAPAVPAHADEVREAREQVCGAAPDERAATLLAWFRRLAAHDVQDLQPVRWGEEDCLPQLPVAEEDAGVVLARLTLPVTAGKAVAKGRTVTVTSDVRAPVLPTATIADLLCGLAPALFGPESEPDAGGPRLDPESVEWADSNTRVSFRLTKPVLAGSWEGGAVVVSSLSPADRGWRREHIDHVELEDDDRRVVVHLDGSPAYPVARLAIRGTGPTPLFGRDPLVPFAGIVGGPPGSVHEGHDTAVNTPLAYSGDSSSRTGAD